mgnify:CR=1 FL=1
MCDGVDADRTLEEINFSVPVNLLGNYRFLVDLKILDAKRLDRTGNLDDNFWHQAKQNLFNIYQESEEEVVFTTSNIDERMNSKRKFSILCAYLLVLAADYVNINKNGQIEITSGQNYNGITQLPLTLPETRRF